MMDVAKKRGLIIDTTTLQQELGIPVIESIAIHPTGGNALIAKLDTMQAKPQSNVPSDMMSEFTHTIRHHWKQPSWR